MLLHKHKAATSCRQLAKGPFSAFGRLAAAIAFFARFAICPVETIAP
jgi:hypothetical protein